MTRITPLPEEKVTPEIRAVYEHVATKYGKLVDPVTVIANHLEVFRAYTKFEGWFAEARQLDDKLKLLVTLKVASLIGCPFCMDLGSAEASSAGITQDQLRDLVAHADSPLFTATQRLGLDYAVAMTSSPVNVPQSMFAQLAEILDSVQIIELTATIAWENYRSRFYHALGIASHGFSDSACCLVQNAGSSPQARSM